MYFTGRIPSAGYALAAQALALYAHYKLPESDRDPVLHRAMELAERAVAADSANAEAYLQSAHVVGRYAQTVGTLTALRQGLAGEIRNLLKTALRLQPDYYHIHIALGGVARGHRQRWPHCTDDVWRKKGIGIAPL